MKCMQIPLLVGAILLTLTCQAQQTAAQNQALTNADVQKMVEAKLSDALIVSKIRGSGCAFDTSTDAILKLKSQGASDGVIEAMVACGKPISQTSTATAPTDPSNPLSPHAPGIYWVTKDKASQSLTRLEASSYGGSKSAGVMGSAFSMGLKKAKWKAELAGAHSALRSSNASPEFWFYFEDASAGFGHGGPGGGQASKPEDFALAKMEMQKAERQLVVGQASALGNSSGLRSQDKIPVEVQKMAPGIYKVTTSRPLEPGEYCFVPPGSAAAFGMAGGQLYDFGIDK